ILTGRYGMPYRPVRICPGSGSYGGRRERTQGRPDHRWHPRHRPRLRLGAGTRLARDRRRA
ncbi:hypothetical protein ACQXW1_16920, partial [Lactiplantibacillus pentosus]